MTIHLWLLPIQEIEIPLSILSVSEQSRYHQYLHPRKQIELLHSRLLLKAALNHFCPEAPPDTHAIADENGRPFWKNRTGRLPIYFSLSHTDAMIALAVAQLPEIGCDMEKIRPRKYERELARRIFGTSEQHYYDKLQNNDLKRIFFYSSWTLKEAYVKAIGTGLRTPLNSLDFTHKILSGNTSLELQQKNWNFHYFNGIDGYALSVATPLLDADIKIETKAPEQLLVLRKQVLSENSP